MEMTLTASRSVPIDRKGNDFSYEVDSFNEAGWSKIIADFADANLYQTWPYGVARSGSNVSRLVVKQGSTMVAAVQSRLARVPLLPLGIAYVLSGPLWKHCNDPKDLEIFRQAVRALRTEYVQGRGWVVRIVPQLNETDDLACRQILEEEGYVFQQKAPRRSTILMNLEPTLDELYRGFHQKWRYHLNKARKENLQIVESEEDKLFDEFSGIFKEMVDRKQLSNLTSSEHCRKAQATLSAREKVRVFLCKSDGRVCAGAICSHLGDTGVYLFGATSNEGIKNNASFFVHWRILEWLKERGCKTYDLNGVNPEANPGGFMFKSRLAGSNGRLVHLLGQFDAYPNAAVKQLVSLAEPVKEWLKKSASR